MSNALRPIMGQENIQLGAELNGGETKTMVGDEVLFLIPFTFLFMYEYIY